MPDRLVTTETVSATEAGFEARSDEGCRLIWLEQPGGNVPLLTFCLLGDNNGSLVMLSFINALKT